MDLKTVIATIESSNCKNAIRFETELYSEMLTGLKHEPIEVIRRIMNYNNCSHGTAIGIYSTSYGLYQIMGFNLYSQLGFNKSVWAFMCDTELQHKSFDKFVLMNGINFSISELMAENNRRKFALIYNGSENVDEYSNKILNTIRSIKNA